MGSCSAYSIGMLMLTTALYIQGQGEQVYRLVNGYSELEGRVETFHQGQWDPCYMSDYQQSTANMICKKLGFSKTEAEFVNVTFFGRIGGLDCDQVGLICRPLKCQDFDVDIVGGAAKVCIDETWNLIHVAPQSSQATVARVICRQLGFSQYNASVEEVADSSALVTVLNCTGEERHLSECGSTTITTTAAIRVTCNRKCHSCKDLSTVITVRSSTALTITWMFPRSLLLRSSLLAYTVKCTSTETRATLPSHIISKTVPKTTTSVELVGLDLEQENYTCCVTAEQGSHHSNYTACTATTRAGPQAIILGVTLGLLGLIAVAAAFIAGGLFYCKKKRSVSKIKKNRKIICASLNELFTSKSATIESKTGTPVSVDIAKKETPVKIARKNSIDEPKFTKKMKNSAKDITTANCVAYTSSIPDITTSTCVAYTTKKSEGHIEAFYEDIPPF